MPRISRTWRVQVKGGIFSSKTRDLLVRVKIKVERMFPDWAMHYIGADPGHYTQVLDMREKKV